MEKIIKFELNYDDYIHLADEAFEKGDIEKNIAYLFKAVSLMPRSVEAYIKIASSYAYIDALALSNRYYFKALSLHPDDEQDEYIRTMLGLNFAALGQSDVAEFYVEDIADYLSEDIARPERKFHIVYPKGEDYYEHVTQKAYSMIREQKLDEAIELLGEVDQKSAHRSLADYLVLMCYMLKDDEDAVIDNAKNMLKKEDNLATKCTLATAYKMEGKDEEADAIIESVLNGDYESTDDIMLILPLMINAGRHEQVIKFSRLLLERIRYKAEIMIWLSEALYNLGRYNEAFSVMRKVENIFGDFTPAKQILALYRKGVEEIPYTTSIPIEAKINAFKRIEAFLLLPVEVAAETVDDMLDLINWAFIEGDEKLLDLIVGKMTEIIIFVHGPYDRFIDSSKLKGDNTADKLLGIIFEQLAVGDHSYTVFSRLIIALLDIAGGRCGIRLDIVAQGCFKDDIIIGSRYYGKMPRPLKQAYKFAVVDILFTDDEPRRSLRTLESIMASILIFKPNEKGEPDQKYLKRLDKISRMRSPVTLMGVLLATVYKDYDEDNDGAAIERYNLNARTFAKYREILFGGRDGDKE